MRCVFIQQRIILYILKVSCPIGWPLDFRRFFGWKNTWCCMRKNPTLTTSEGSTKIEALKPVGFFHCDTRHQSLGNLFLHKRIGLQFCNYVCCVVPHDELIPSRLGDSHRGSIQSQSFPPYARPFWSKAPWDWRNVICERCWSRRFVDFDSVILFFEQHQIIFWQVQWPVLCDLCLDPS